MTRPIRRKKPAPDVDPFIEKFFNKKPDRRGRPPEYRPDVLRERLDALTKELSRRYKKKGTWPETGTKWSKGTETYIRKWWPHGLDELAEWGALPDRPFPARAIAVRLTPRKGVGGLKEMIYFLLSTRLRLTKHAIESLLRKK